MLALRLLTMLLTREAAQPITDVARIPGQADFEAMIGRRRRELHAITNRLIDDSAFGLDDWFEQFDAILLEGHTHAWQLGRNLAGDLSDDINDLLRGMDRRDEESYYLRGFLEALRGKDARYWDEELDAWRDDAIKARQDLYLGKMRATANDAFVESTPPALDEFYWRLGAVEDHCAECPELAELSPYEKATMFTHPGACDTPCKMNCTCYLERGDGVVGFKRVEL